MGWILLWLMIGYSTATVAAYKELMDKGELTVKTLAQSAALAFLGPILTIIVIIIFAFDFFEAHGDKVVLKRTDESEGG
jgi:hypothetical protein